MRKSSASYDTLDHVMWRYHPEQYFNKKGRPPTSLERDYQRSNLYKSEIVLVGKSKKFNSLNEIQEYLDEITHSQWWKEKFPQLQVLMKPCTHNQKRGYAKYGFEQPVITIPEFNWFEYYIIHELTHCLVYKHASMFHAHHGRLFCRLYLELVYNLLGAQAFGNFYKSMLRHGVKFYPR